MTRARPWVLAVTVLACLLLANVLFAQEIVMTYRGSGGAAGICAETGIVAWFDSTSGVTVPVSTEVSSWVDKCGGGHDLVQSTSSLRPNTTTINTEQWIDFDGVDDEIEDTSFPDCADQAVVYMGVRFINTLSNQGVFSWDNGTASGGISFFYDLGTTDFFGRVASGGVNDARFDSPSSATERTSVWIVDYEGVTAQDVLIVEDKVQRGADVSTGALDNVLSSLLLGNIANAGAYPGRIALRHLVFFCTDQTIVKRDEISDIIELDIP